MIKKFNEISKTVGYNVLVCSNNDILPVENLESEAQNIVIFDYFVCDKNKKTLINYFIRGRHKNCCLFESIFLWNTEGHKVKLQSFLCL